MGKPSCKKCGRDKPPGRCPICHAAYRVKWRAEHPKYSTAWLRAHPGYAARRRKSTPGVIQKEFEIWVKSQYSLTVEDYAWILHGQDFKCAICRVALNMRRNAAVDHCHKSGTVRGILCKACNTAIGQLEDDTNRLSNAIAYLTKHRSTAVMEAA